MRWVCCSSLLLAALPALIGCGPVERGPRPVVLITVDTLRADHLGCYGYGLPTSPEIDRFAAAGRVYDNAWAHGPSTWSATASLMTGFLPHETTVIRDVPLPGAATTLAETLADGGYRTAAVVSNFVLREGRGYDQGFDSYDATFDDAETVRGLPERGAEATTDAALAWLADARAPSFFLWVHYQDPHGPYMPPGDTVPVFRGADLPPRLLPRNPDLSGYRGIPLYQQVEGEDDFHDYVARYDGEIRHLDTHFGRLVRALPADALVVFTSDHGESLGERDFYFVHGQHLHDELIRVPLIIRDGLAAGSRLADPVQHLDLLPTILAAAGLPEPAGLRGRDLRTGEASAPVEVVAEMAYQMALLQSGFKLLYTFREERFQLFDLIADPGETRDLVHDPGQRDRVRRMMFAMQRQRQEDRLELEPVRAPALSEEERRKLRSLGYVAD